MIAEKVTLLGFLDPILGAAAHADLPAFPWKERGMLFAIVEPRRQLRGDFRRTAKRPKTIYGVVRGPRDGMPCSLAQSVSGANQPVGINVEPERWHFQSLSQMHQSVRAIGGSLSLVSITRRCKARALPGDVSARFEPPMSPRYG